MKHKSIFFDITKNIMFLIFLLYAVTLVLPFVFMIINSLKGNVEFFSGNIWSFPKNPTLSNYVNAFLNFPTTGKIAGKTVEFNMISMLFVSLGITLATTVLNTLVASCLAYVLARYEFKGRALIYSVIILVMVVPVIGTLPSKYKLMSNLHLIDNPIGLILLYASGLGMPFFILYGFFKNISPGYIEAAFVDGATDAKAFFKIMLPIARPALVSVSVIYAIGIWNDYTTASIFMKNIPTLAVGLRKMLVDLQHRAAFPESFAAMAIALLPILIIFICFQKTIMQNTVAGGLKG